MIYFLIWIRGSFSKLTTPSWFRPAGFGVSDRYDWKEIEFILTKDPLDHNPASGARWPKNSLLFKPYLRLVIGVASFATAAIFIFGPDSIEQCGKADGERVAATFIAALIAVLGTLYTASKQLRAKVRSENRQKWINDVRDTVAGILNYVQKQNQSTYVANKLIQTSYANLARIRLELLLNPSERDHRTLSTLLRKAYNIPQIELDKSVFESLELVKNIDPYAKPEDFEKLITWIIRLSNAMLKREWELVKYGD